MDVNTPRESGRPSQGSVGDPTTDDRLLLTAEEARVLGCLVEKELTTPDYYPLTMNSLITACNQSSNRDPIVRYDETVVAHAIDGLRDKKLVRWVKEARSRAAKYRHDLETVPGLSIPERSLLAVLLLRGPQTSGELRTRTDRYHEFASPEDVEGILKGMAAREEPLVERLERQPGQKEARWRELWNADLRAEVGTATPPPASAGSGSPTRTTGLVRPSSPASADTAALIDRISELEARLARIERELGLNDE
jgi:uncharacterized protein YceH (UPF0502 family)